jgi:hypothetical protein
MSRSLMQARSVVALGILVALIGLAVFKTQPALNRWANGERSGATAIGMSRSVVAAQCQLYLANFDIEQRVAVSVLLRRFGESAPVAPCRPGSHAAYAVNLGDKPLPPTFAAHCTTRWQELRLENRVTMLRCPSFRAGPIPDQNAASGAPLVTVVHLRVPTRLPKPSQLFRAG